MVSGSSSSSPLDPWDSVVIPLCMAIVLWVWRRGPVAPGGLRSRFGMVTAGLAAFATVATSQTPSDCGIIYVWTSGDSVMAQRAVTHYDCAKEYRRSASGAFGSEDGGTTWTAWNSYDYEREHDSTLSQEAATPRGKYFIRGPDVMLQTVDGEVETAYSSKHLRASGNQWFQAQEAKHLDIPTISRGPTSIVYDQNSGNVVVAMGIQGVMSGTPDGSWTAVSVGTYSPADFSFWNKAKSLFSTFSFWAAVFGFPLPVILISLYVTSLMRGQVSVLDHLGFAILSGIPTAISSIVAIILLYSVGLYWEASKPLGVYVLTDFPFAALALPTVLMCFLWAAFFIWRSEWNLPTWPAFGFYLAMAFFVALSYIVWLQSGVSLTFARTMAAILCIATAVTLAVYLVKINSPMAAGPLSES